jgi:hypothetical protein
VAARLTGVVAANGGAWARQASRSPDVPVKTQERTVRDATHVGGGGHRMPARVRSAGRILPVAGRPGGNLPAYLSGSERQKDSGNVVVVVRYQHDPGVRTQGVYCSTGR